MRGRSKKREEKTIRPGSRRERRLAGSSLPDVVLDEAKSAEEQSEGAKSEVTQSEGAKSAEEQAEVTQSEATLSADAESAAPRHDDSIAADETDGDAPGKPSTEEGGAS